MSEYSLSLWLAKMRDTNKIHTLIKIKILSHFSPASYTADLWRHWTRLRKCWYYFITVPSLTLKIARSPAMRFFFLWGQRHVYVTDKFYVPSMQYLLQALPNATVLLSYWQEEDIESVEDLDYRYDVHVLDDLCAHNGHLLYVPKSWRLYLSFSVPLTCVRHLFVNKSH